MPAVFNSQTGVMVSNPNPYPDGQILDTTPVTVAATGTTQTTAFALVDAINIISNNTAANGVILPVPTAGQRIIVYPALATNAPKVYPPVGGSINNGTVNASVANTAQKGVEYIAMDTVGNYFTVGL